MGSYVWISPQLLTIFLGSCRTFKRWAPTGSSESSRRGKSWRFIALPLPAMFLLPHLWLQNKLVFKLLLWMDPSTFPPQKWVQINPIPLYLFLSSIPSKQCKKLLIQKQQLYSYCYLWWTWPQGSQAFDSCFQEHVSFSLWARTLECHKQSLMDHSDGSAETRVLIETGAVRTYLLEFQRTTESLGIGLEAFMLHSSKLYWTLSKPNLKVIK